MMFYCSTRMATGRQWVKHRYNLFIFYPCDALLGTSICYRAVSVYLCVTSRNCVERVERGTISVSWQRGPKTLVFSDVKIL